MELFRAKKEALDQEESKRTLLALKSTKSARNVTFAKSEESVSQARPRAYQAYTVGEEVLVREVWVSQVRLLIRQVRLEAVKDTLLY